MKQIFDDLSQQISEITTKKYSTSFSLGIKCLHSDLHKPIYSIYGFVRFADEIVFFAKESVASWPTFDVEVRSTLEINTEFAVLSDPEKEIREIFQSL